MRIRIRANLAISSGIIRHGLCQLEPTLAPEQIVISWNGASSLQITVPDWPGGEQALREAVERIIAPYLKAAPVMVPVSLKQMLIGSSKVAMPVASRKMGMW